MSSERFIPHGLRARLTNHETSGHKLPKFQVEGTLETLAISSETITNLCTAGRHCCSRYQLSRPTGLGATSVGDLEHDDPEGLLFDHNGANRQWSLRCRFVGKV